MDKNELRIKMKKMRKNIPEVKLANERIQMQLLSLPEILSADTVFSYVSFGTEPATHDAIRVMLSLGKTVCVPKTRGDGVMNAVKLESLRTLEPGRFRAPEPKKGEKLKKNDINVVIMPGICYDKMGFRLGYGKGFYDRYLAGFQGLKVGLCFDECLIDDVLHEPHDTAADTLVTQSRVIRISGTRK